MTKKITLIRILIIGLVQVTASTSILSKTVSAQNYNELCQHYFSETLNNAREGKPYLSLNELTFYYCSQVLSPQQLEIVNDEIYLASLESICDSASKVGLLTSNYACGFTEVYRQYLNQRKQELGIFY